MKSDTTQSPDSLGSPSGSALFVPLMTRYYEAFERGDKTEELRLYGPRWNEKTCQVGREVTLSKGYGKKHRLHGRIWKFKRQHGSTFGSTYKAAILDRYKTLDVWIACISIELSGKCAPCGTDRGEKCWGHCVGTFSSQNTR
jgi:hypothetical protein